MPHIFADVTNQRFYFRKYDWRTLTSNKNTISWQMAERFAQQMRK